MVCCQETIWMVRWGIQQAVLAEAGMQLEMIEECETGRRSEGKTNYSL